MLLAAGACSGSANAGAGPDGGAADADPWAGCPAARAGASSAAPVLLVAETAVYCASFGASSGGAVITPEIFQHKAMLRLAPGRYPLPAAASGELALPVCVRFGEGQAAVAPASQSWKVERSGNHYSYSFSAPLAGGVLELVMDAEAPPGEAVALALDGSEVELWVQPNYNFAWCAASSGCPDGRYFDSCTHPNSRRSVHEMTSSAGSLTFELRIFPGASTPPAALVRGAGTFRGHAFDQRSYWRLGYSPSQHHFARGFGVLFDAPIDGVCGIAIDRVADTGDVTEARARTLDCALQPLDELPLTDGRVMN